MGALVIHANRSRTMCAYCYIHFIISVIPTRIVYLFHSFFYQFHLQESVLIYITGIHSPKEQ